MELLIKVITSGYEQCLYNNTTNDFLVVVREKLNDANWCYSYRYLSCTKSFFNTCFHFFLALMWWKFRRHEKLHDILSILVTGF